MMSQPPEGLSPHSESASIELRAHHLLCALTFRSRGYGTDFVRKFDAILQQLIDGQPVTLSRRADQLCQCEQNCGLCHTEQSVKRDELAVVAIRQLLDIGGERESFVLTAERLNSLRRAFADGTLRSACHGCAWFEFCSSIAANGFRRAHLQLPV